MTFECLAQSTLIVAIIVGRPLRMILGPIAVHGSVCTYRMTLEVGSSMQCRLSGRVGDDLHLVLLVRKSRFVIGTQVEVV